MRTLIAIAFGCALVLGITHSAGSDVRPEPGLTSPAAEDSTDEVPGEIETSYECKYSPYCQKASQCVAYCAGGLAVCSNGCCACAS